MQQFSARFISTFMCFIAWAGTCVANKKDEDFISKVWDEKFCVKTWNSIPRLPLSKLLTASFIAVGDNCRIIQSMTGSSQQISETTEYSESWTLPWHWLELNIQIFWSKPTTLLLTFIICFASNVLTNVVLVTSRHFTLIFVLFLGEWQIVNTRKCLVSTRKSMEYFPLYPQ